MNLESFRKRLIVRVTTPPEILYALMRHWFLIAVCFGIAAAALCAQYATQPNLYDSRIALHLNINDSLVVEQTSDELEPGDLSGRREDAGLFASRVQILTSETVLRDVAENMEPTRILTQEQDPLRPYYGRVRRFLSKLKLLATDALDVVRRPQPPDHSYECDIQKAVQSLRQRSRVTSDPESCTITLYLRGNNRDLLQAELTQWVDSYKSRLKALSTKIRDEFIESRRSWWKKLEDEAQEKLDTFKRNNPGISSQAHNLLLQEILSLQSRRADLEKRLELGPELSSLRGAESGNAASEREAILQEKTGLQVELSQARYLNGPESEKARALEKAVQDLERRLQSLEPAVDPEASRRAEMEGSIRSLAVMISESMRRYTAMGEALDKLRILEEDLRIAQRTRSSYQLMQLESADLAAARGTVEVQVCDGPFVNWEPVDARRELHILAGSAVGLLVGVLLALTREALATRIRFKNDVTSEFGLPVVAVIPRK